MKRKNNINEYIDYLKLSKVKTSNIDETIICVWNDWSKKCKYIFKMVEKSLKLGLISSSEKNALKIKLK